MNPMKPTDQAFIRKVSELSGRNANERIGGSESVYQQVESPAVGRRHHTLMKTI